MPAPNPTPYNLAVYHAQNLANALQLMVERRTPAMVAQSRSVLEGYRASSVHPLANMTKKERRDNPVLQLGGPDWVEIFYALDSKANAIERGDYDPEDKRGESRDWVKHLRQIMGRIRAAGIPV